MENYQYPEISSLNGGNGWLPLVKRSESHSPPAMSVYIRIPQDDIDKTAYVSNTQPISSRVMPGGMSDAANPGNGGRYGGNVDDWWIWRGRHPEKVVPTTADYDATKNATDFGMNNRLPAYHATMLNTLYEISTEENADLQDGELQSTAPWPWGTSTSQPPVTTAKSTIGATLSNSLPSFPWFEDDAKKLTTSPSSDATFTLTTVASSTHSTLGGGVTDFLASIGTSTWHFGIFNYTGPNTGISAAHLGNISQTTFDAEVYEGLSTLTTYIAASIFASLLVVSLVCNLLILCTILSRHYLGQNFFILYVSLAASDLLASMLLVPVLILSILDSEKVPYGVCMLISTSMVLTIFVSMGSIVSISIIRWWQFYNFNQTRTHEKVVIRLIILVLWVSGTGIALGFALHNVFRASSTCSFEFWKSTLTNTLPLTTVCATFGLLVVALVNYLTIKKIKKKSIYSENQTQLSRNSTNNHFTRIIGHHPSYSKEQNGEPATSDLSSLGGDYSHGRMRGESLSRSQTQQSSRRQNEASPVLNTHLANEYLEVNQRQSNSLTVKPKESGESSTNEPSQTSGSLPPKINSSPPPLPPSNPPSLPLPVATVSQTSKSSVEEEAPLSESSAISFRRPASDLQPLTGSSESEPESEHLYQVIEPQDTQEEVVPHASSHMPSTSKAVQPGVSIALPNAVVSNYSIPAETKQHRTTIIDPVTVPPDTHTVNTMAWKLRKVYDYLPRIMQKSRVETFYDLPVMQGQSRKPSPWPLLHGLQNEADPQGQESLKDIDDAKSEGNVSKEEDVVEKDCTGYMADMSAPSSKQSTPQQKLNRSQRIARLSALTSARTTSRFSSAVESEDEERERTQGGNTQSTERKYQYEFGDAAPQPDGSKSMPNGYLMHPVRQKCVRTSHRLVALFAIAYMPLLGAQFSVYLGIFSSSNYALDMLVLVTFTYVLALMAVHPSLYGYQSPILRNAIRKIAKRVVHPSRLGNSSTARSSPSEQLFQYEFFQQRSSRSAIDRVPTPAPTDCSINKASDNPNTRLPSSAGQYLRKVLNQGSASVDVETCTPASTY